MKKRRTAIQIPRDGVEIRPDFNEDLASAFALKFEEIIQALQT